MEKAGDKLILPIDTVAAKAFAADAEHRTVAVADMAEDEMGLDIGAASIELFTKALEGSKNCCLEWTYGSI